jgi:phosphoserine phosphatase RsbU/P
MVRQWELGLGIRKAQGVADKNNRTPRRTVFPISVKLIATTGLLLVAVAATSSVYTHRALKRMAEQDAVRRREAGESAIVERARLVARHAATSAGLPLAEGNFTHLASLVETTVHTDDQVEWLMIADAESARVVARSTGAPADTVLDDSLSRQVLDLSTEEVLSARGTAGATNYLVGAKVRAGDQLVGQLRMSVTTRALEEELVQAIAAARARANETAGQLLFVAGAVLLIGLVLALFQGFRMTRPLHVLSAQAARLASGHLESRVELSSRDEIGVLADSFNYMADQLGHLIRETADKASLEKEMSLARDIQMTMLPSASLLNHGPFRVLGYAETATSCGGDWWSVRKLSDDRVLIIVGDVTGHGMPAAMIVATARGAVEALAEAGGHLLTPKGVLRAMDTAIRNVGSHQLHMTGFAALIDPNRQTIEYANAGHNFPYLLRHSGDGAAPNLTSLVASGNPLGDQERRYIGTDCKPLAAGDVIVCYTDGLIERANADGRRWGERELRRLLSQTPVDNEDALGALRSRIIQQMNDFGTGHPADDDVTLVLCQYLPAAGERQSRAAQSM